MADETPRFRDKVMVLILADKPDYVRGSNINWTLVARDLPGDVHPETLRKALVGERWPSTKLIEAVATFLDIDPTEFGEYRINRAREAVDPDAVGYDVALNSADALLTAARR